MPKCDFNKVAEQTSAWMFSCKFVTYFQNIFSLEHLWMAASEYCKAYKNIQNILPSFKVRRNFISSLNLAIL